MNIVYALWMKFFALKTISKLIYLEAFIVGLDFSNLSGFSTFFLQYF